MNDLFHEKFNGKMQRVGRGGISSMLDNKKELGLAVPKAPDRPEFALQPTYSSSDPEARTPALHNGLGLQYSQDQSFARPNQRLDPYFGPNADPGPVDHRSLLRQNRGLASMEMPQNYSPIVMRSPDPEQFAKKARQTEQPARKAALSDTKHSQPPRRSNTRTIKSEQQVPDSSNLFRHNAYNNVFDKEVAPFDQIANLETERAIRAKTKQQPEQKGMRRNPSKSAGNIGLGLNRQALLPSINPNSQSNTKPKPLKSSQLATGAVLQLQNSYAVDRLNYRDPIPKPDSFYTKPDLNSRFQTQAPAGQQAPMLIRRQDGYGGRPSPLVLPQNKRTAVPDALDPINKQIIALQRDLAMLDDKYHFYENKLATNNLRNH